MTHSFYCFINCLKTEWGGGNISYSQMSANMGNSKCVEPSIHGTLQGVNLAVRVYVGIIASHEFKLFNNTSINSTSTYFSTKGFTKLRKITLSKDKTWGC